MNESFGMSAELDKLGPDLVQFQREVVDPNKDAANPHFRSKFVPLESAIEALRPVANAHNFSITQWRSGRGLVTLFLHTSGQYIYGDAELILEKQTPQGMGSAITYERRYGLLAATGTAGDVDDDAEAAHGRGGQAGSKPDHPSYDRAVKSADEAKGISDKPLIAERALIDRFTGSIGGATSLSGLQMVGLAIKESGLSNAAKDGLHGVYSKKKRDLESVDESSDPIS
jgi:hypothetical protein